MKFFLKFLNIQYTKMQRDHLIMQKVMLVSSELTVTTLVLHILHCCTYTEYYPHAATDHRKVNQYRGQQQVV